MYPDFSKHISCILILIKGHAYPRYPERYFKAFKFCDFNPFSASLLLPLLGTNVLSSTAKIELQMHTESVVIAISSKIFGALFTVYSEHAAGLPYRLAALCV